MKKIFMKFEILAFILKKKLFKILAFLSYNPIGVEYTVMHRERGICYGSRKITINNNNLYK